MQVYKTLGKAGVAQLLEKKSRFIGCALPVTTEEEAGAHLAAVKKQHPGATHYVYAYTLREQGRTRYSDDGEPHGTAGMPVLEVLRGEEVFDAAVVVVRYFGGTLLGTGGLQRAYGAAAKAAVLAAGVQEISLCTRYTLSLPYALRDSAAQLVEQACTKEVNFDYAGEVTLTYIMKVGQGDELALALQNLTKGRAPTQSEPFYMPF
ncbi:YigZ family protein [Ruminococcaceae bacterium OttesenSCG-928-N02]|nr:YigZ family protein [Ruminococcaceae bacterium OttesenSCG-928-N02]